jgi:hypothetical protein
VELIELPRGAGAPVLPRVMTQEERERNKAELETMLWQANHFAADPENALVWRMSQRRLDAEAIRDAILASSGQLDLTPLVGSSMAARGDGPIGQFRQFPNAGVPEDELVEAGARSNARSVYLAIARELPPDALAVFDFAEPGFVSGNRETINVPSQALYLLNSPFIATAAQKLGERVMATCPPKGSGDTSANLAARVQLAYSLVFSRPPTAAEGQAASEFFANFPAVSGSRNVRAVSTGADDATSDVWASFSRVLFASAEFRFLK